MSAFANTKLYYSCRSQRARGLSSRSTGSRLMKTRRVCLQRPRVVSPSSGGVTLFDTFFLGRDRVGQMGSEFHSQGLGSGFSWLPSCLERRANSFSEHTVLVFRFACILYLVTSTWFHWPSRNGWKLCHSTTSWLLAQLSTITRYSTYM